MKIIIETEEIDKDEELIKVYIRYVLKMFKIIDIKVEKVEKQKIKMNKEEIQKVIIEEVDDVINNLLPKLSKSIDRRSVKLLLQGLKKAIIKDLK